MFSTTVWDVWEMRGSPQLTLQQFMDAELAKHSVKVHHVLSVVVVRHRHLQLLDDPKFHSMHGSIPKGGLV